MDGKIVIGIAGMPGAGKATVREALAEMGCSVVVMGDEIREEVKRRGLEPSPENMGMVMLKLREEEGPTVVARRCIPKIKRARARIVVVDGIRSLDEVNEFKKHFPNFILVAVHASPETRFKRLFARRRSDDPKGWKTFVERDLRELSVGLGNAIAMADYILINEETKNQLKKEVKKLLESVLKDG